jgi:hypothetical protein
MKSSIGKKSNLGTIIYENDKCAVALQEKEKSLDISILPKKGENIHYPLGIMLGSNGLIYEYPTKEN